MDGDGSAAEEDCDDSDPNVYPGAPERCDGKANDCGSGTWTAAEEAGLASHFGPDGAFQEDLSADLAAGTSAAPVMVALPAEGTLQICAGTWYAGLVASAGAELAVVGQGGSAEVILDTAGREGFNPLVVDGAQLEVRGLTLYRGGGQSCSYGSCGGAIYVVDDGGPSLLQLEDLVMSGSFNWYGPGIYASGSVEISISDSLISGNSGYVSGGLWLMDGATLSMEGSQISGNSAVNSGAAVYLRDAELTCLGSAGTAAGVHSNSTVYPGLGQVVVVDSGGALRSELCDWGEGATENSYWDISAGDTIYSYGNDETFTCDGAGCY
jgi:hypothetical protein